MLELAAKDRELERRFQDLAQRVRGLDKEDQGRVREELLKIANEQFEVRQQQRLLRVKRLEAELNEVKESVAKEGGEREQLIERRLRDLLGEPRD
jgi:hypothetical protein